MTGFPRVSVISIFFNAELYFEEAIDSVLAQNYADFELLLVDDGSSDGSTAIAQSYARRWPSKVFYFAHRGRQNRGMSATRNLGLAHARAPLVAFIDADDRWHPAKLREQAAIFDKHERLGAVCGTVNYWRSWSGGEDVLVPTGHCQDVLVAPPEAALALYPLGEAAAPCPSDLMLSKTFVEQVGGFEESFTGDLQMYEDQAFLAKLYLVAPLYFASNCWLDYRQHENSIVAKVTQSGEYDRVRRHFLDWLGGYLRHQNLADLRIHAAHRRAQRPYEQPWLHAMHTFGEKLVRRAEALLRARTGA